MKEFNLEQALKGEYVALRNGNKALILYQLPDNLKYVRGTNLSYCLHGIAFNEKGEVANTSIAWTKDGKYSTMFDTCLDIIGMWEEPPERITLENLPKPFIPKVGETYYFIFWGGGIGREEFMGSHVDYNAAKCGWCFRTESDALEWERALQEIMKN
jgi:pyruvate kinase|nr:MAG TPA: Albumin I chain a [Caudoviricetes sp.]